MCDTNWYLFKIYLLLFSHKIMIIILTVCSFWKNYCLGIETLNIYFLGYFFKAAPAPKLLKKMSRIQTYADSETSKENEPDPDFCRLRNFKRKWAGSGLLPDPDFCRLRNLKTKRRIRTFAGSETSKKNEPDPDFYRFRNFEGKWAGSGLLPTPWHRIE